MASSFLQVGFLFNVLLILLILASWQKFTVYTFLFGNNWIYISVKLHVLDISYEYGYILCIYGTLKGHSNRSTFLPQFLLHCLFVAITSRITTFRKQSSFGRFMFHGGIANIGRQW